MAPVGAQCVAAGRVASEASRSRADYTYLYSLTRPRRPSPFNSRSSVVERPQLIADLYRPFHTIPITVPRTGTCPHCGLGDITRVFPLWAKLVACFLFPFGLLALCFNYEDRCPACNYVSPK